MERYHCGVCVDPEDVDQVVLALRRLLEHPEEARQMGENGPQSRPGGIQLERGGTDAAGALSRLERIL